MELKEIKIDFLLHIIKNKFVTKNSQKIVGGVDYYFMIWGLRDAGLVRNDGLTKNNEKIWVLSDTGLKVAEMLPELKKIYLRRKEIEDKIKEMVD
jgi:hypothetical protein